MKKRNFFLIGTLALVAFAACIDKDVYNPEYANEVRQSQYAKAFKQVFGEIDPNHDWGFGTSATKAITTRATRGYTFSGDDESVYKSAVPEGLHEVSEYNLIYGVPNYSEFYVSENTTSVNCWEGGCDIYFPAGKYTIDSWSVKANTNVYILPRAEITFTNSVNINYPGSWSIAEGATVTFEKDLTYNFVLYNRGTLTAAKIALYSNAKIINAGEISVDTDVDVKNTSCEFVNLGQLECQNVNIEGSGKFQNVGEANVSGTTTVNSNNCTWDNQGTYTTNDLIYYAGSDEIHNGCKLEIKNLFKILLGEGDRSSKLFKISAQSSIVTKYFQMGIGYLEMGENSMLKVTEQALMGITKADYGVYGPETGGYAVFTAKEIVGGAVYNWGIQTTLSGNMATYGGNLYVATDSHFAQGYSGQYPYYDLKGNAQIIEGKDAAPIYIALTECNPGYGTKVVATTSYTVKYMEQGTNKELSPAQEVSNKNVGDVITETAITIPNYTCVSASPTDATITLVEDVTQNVIIFYYKKNTTTSDTDSVETARYRVFAEDLGSIGDFDFNDVVFDVIQYTKNSQEYTDVVIQAAGGTLPLVLDIPGLTEKIEVHSKFGVNTNVMVNTGSGPTVEKEKLPRYTVTGTVEPADIDIWVTYSSQEQPEKIIAPIGEAPGKFCVPNTTQPWASERVSIAKDFEGFKKWVGNSNYTWWNQLVIP